jgi:lactoylglutathione lyase
MEKETLLSLVVIRSGNMDRAATFYGALGVSMIKHAHGRSPEHYSGSLGGLVLEIYPAQGAGDSTARVRLGFKVDDLKKTVEAVRKVGGKVLTEPALTAFGFAATVEDFDGHKVEIYAMS